MNEIKDKLRFCVKRERLLRNLYRHGVMGIQKTDGAVKKDHFYSTEEARVKMNQEKEKIRERRMRQLEVMNAVSDQIDLCHSKESFTRHDKTPVVDIFQEWKRKQVSPVRFKNTHESLFLPARTTPKMERLKYLIQENTKGRQFNILTNGSNTPINQL